jgi:cell wall-associated NlpC family hydrolase
MAADRSHPVFAPDGCPTTPPADTLRGLAATNHLTLYQICTDSVRLARSPAAALAIRFALSELGTPYSQPFRNSPHIYDCSSFVSRAYQAAGVPIAYPATPDRIDGGPGQNTPSSQQEVAAPWAVPVTPATALPGDLVFFPGADPPNGHVGIVLADGLLVHTNETGDVAHVDTLDAATASAWRAVDPAKVVIPATRGATAFALAVKTARDRYTTSASDLVRIQQELATAARERALAAKRVQAAQDKQTQAAHLSELAQDRLRQVAVLDYMQGGAIDNVALLLSAPTMVRLARDQTLLGVAGDKTQNLVIAYEKARAAAVREEALFQQRLSAIDARINGLHQAADDAQRALTSASVDPASPILGNAQLSAAQLVAWYSSTGEQAQTSVPIDVLAQLYITEGQQAGVRGDVAFAEAAFDTGDFTFPATGALSGHDNGLSLIGGCDTCQLIPWYASAQLAVRAQVQLLRSLADPAVTATSLGAAPVVNGVLDVHAKGTIRSWSELRGMVLPASDYGTAIMKIYAEITAWAAANPAPHQ